MILNEHETVGSKTVSQTMSLCKRRLSGEPIDHILGTREFYGRNFIVTKDVLSPRPETEGVIDVALEVLKGVKAPRILDLGTGSGAIMLTLLSEIPDARGTAVDMSGAAIEIARQNAKKLDITDRLTLLQGDWFAPVEGSFDLIVSNPPYITGAAMKALPQEVADYDPDIALRGGQDGLKAYRRIISESQRFLKPDGYIVFEVGFDQGESVPELLSHAGFAEIRVHKDLSGHDRVTMAQHQQN